MKSISLEELKNAGIPACIVEAKPVKVVPKRRLFTVGAICAGAAAALVAGFFLMKKKDITIKLCCEMSNHDGDGEHCCYPREGMEPEEAPASEPAAEASEEASEEAAEPEA